MKYKNSEELKQAIVEWLKENYDNQEVKELEDMFLSLGEFSSPLSEAMEDLTGICVEDVESYGNYRKQVTFPDKRTGIMSVWTYDHKFSDTIFEDLFILYELISPYME